MQNMLQTVKWAKAESLASFSTGQRPVNGMPVGSKPQRGGIKMAGFLFPRDDDAPLGLVGILQSHTGRCPVLKDERLSAFIMGTARQKVVKNFDHPDGKTFKVTNCDLKRGPSNLKSKFLTSNEENLKIKIFDLKISKSRRDASSVESRAGMFASRRDATPRGSSRRNFSHTPPNLPSLRDGHSFQSFSTELPSLRDNMPPFLPSLRQPFSTELPSLRDDHSFSNHFLPGSHPSGMMIAA